jgi:hypothetical protein
LIVTTILGFLIFLNRSVHSYVGWMEQGLAWSAFKVTQIPSGLYVDTGL